MEDPKKRHRRKHYDVKLISSMRTPIGFPYFKKEKCKAYHKTLDVTFIFNSIRGTMVHTLCAACIELFFKKKAIILYRIGIFQKL